MSKRGKRASTEERILANRLIESGKSSAEVAKLMGVGRRTVLRWRQQYRTGGWTGMHVKSGAGRPAKMSAGQVDRLRSWLFTTCPREWGFESELWTRTLVRALIREWFHVNVSPVTVTRTLQRMGISSELPICSAFRQSLGEVRDWENRVYPQLRAEAQRREATILFVDELPVSGIPTAKTIAKQGGRWAPASEGSEVSVLCALTLRAEHLFRAHWGKVEPRHFVGFCERLMIDVPGNVFIVTDISALHTSPEVTQFAENNAGNIRFCYFPDYSQITLDVS